MPESYRPERPESNTTVGVLHVDAVGGRIGLCE